MSINGSNTQSHLIWRTFTCDPVISGRTADGSIGRVRPDGLSGDLVRGRWAIKSIWIGLMPHLINRPRCCWLPSILWSDIVCERERLHRGTYPNTLLPIIINIISDKNDHISRFMCERVLLEAFNANSPVNRQHRITDTLWRQPAKVRRTVIGCT